MAAFVYWIEAGDTESLDAIEPAGKCMVDRVDAIFLADWLRAAQLSELRSLGLTNIGDN